MTIVIEKYTDNSSGLCAEIEIEKYSCLFTLEISKPYEDDSSLAYLIFKQSYIEKAYARKAIKRYGNFRKEEI